MVNRIAVMIEKGRTRTVNVWFAANIEVEMPPGFDPESEDAGRLISEAIGRQYPELAGGRIEVNGGTCMSIDGFEVNATPPLV